MDATIKFLSEAVEENCVSCLENKILCGEVSGTHMNTFRIKSHEHFVMEFRIRPT